MAEQGRRTVRDAGRILRQPYYLLRPRLWRERLDIVDSRTMISRSARYVYLRVPKAANSTVVRTLLDHFPEPGFAAEDPERAKTGMPHFGDLGLHDLAPLKGFFVFTVVRSPYARTLSAFLDKFRGGDKHLDRFGDRVARFDAGAVSFRGFCRYLAAGGEAENAHWMRQTRLTGLADRIDFVGRVETLEAPAVPTDSLEIVEPGLVFAGFFLPLPEEPLEPGLAWSDSVVRTLPRSPSGTIRLESIGRYRALGDTMIFDESVLVVEYERSLTYGAEGGVAGRAEEAVLSLRGSEEGRFLFAPVAGKMLGREYSGTLRGKIGPAAGGRGGAVREIYEYRGTTSLTGGKP